MHRDLVSGSSAHSQQAEWEPRPPGAIQALEALQEDQRHNWEATPFNHREDLRRKLFQDRVSAALPATIPSNLGEIDFTKLFAETTSPEAEDEIRQQVDNLLHQYRLDDPTQWSQYEPPGIAWGLAKLCGRIERTIKSAQSWSLNSVPAVGTLATGQPVAVIQTAPDDAVPPKDHTVIVVENGTFEFAARLAQVGVMSLLEFDHYETFGMSSPATAQILCDIAASQSIADSSLDVSARKLPPGLENLKPLVDATCHAIIAFILSHEYGHLLSDDLASHHMGSDGVVEPEVEYEADAVGAAITKCVIDETTDQPFAAVLGPVLYLAGVNIRDRLNAIFDPDDNGHPPADKRKDELLEVIRSVLEPKEKYGTYAERAATAYKQVMSIWEHIEPVVRTERDELQHIRDLYKDRDSDLLMLRIFAMRSLWSCYTQSTADSS